MDFALQLLAMAVACYGSYRLGYSVATARAMAIMEREAALLDAAIKEAQEATR